jgi:hypothetical protein
MQQRTLIVLVAMPFILRVGNRPSDSNTVLRYRSPSQVSRVLPSDGTSPLTFALVNGLKYAPDGSPHRFGVEQPFGEVTREIAGMSLGTKQCGTSVSLTDALWTGAGKRKKPPGQRRVVC